MTAKQTTEKRRALNQLDELIVEIVRSMPKEERSSIIEAIKGE